MNNFDPEQYFVEQYIIGEVVAESYSSMQVGTVSETLQDHRLLLFDDNNRKALKGLIVWRSMTKDEKKVVVEKYLKWCEIPIGQHQSYITEYFGRENANEQFLIQHKKDLLQYNRKNRRVAASIIPSLASRLLSMYAKKKSAGDHTDEISAVLSGLVEGEFDVVWVIFRRLSEYFKSPTDLPPPIQFCIPIETTDNTMRKLLVRLLILMEFIERVLALRQVMPNIVAFRISPSYYKDYLLNFIIIGKYRVCSIIEGRDSIIKDLILSFYKKTVLVYTWDMLVEATDLYRACMRMPSLLSESLSM
jgi:hypothetical protein